MVHDRTFSELDPFPFIVSLNTEMPDINPLLLSWSLPEGYFPDSYVPAFPRENAYGRYA